MTTNKLVPGTVLFTVFWAALTAFGSVILTGRVARANQLYGTIGFIIGLIFWIYLGAYGALLSSELNAVRAMRLYPRTLFGPPSTAIDERALLSRARTEELVPGQVVEVRYAPPHAPPGSAHRVLMVGDQATDGSTDRRHRTATGRRPLRPDRSGQDAGEGPDGGDEPDAGHHERAHRRRPAEVAVVGLHRRADER